MATHFIHLILAENAVRNAGLSEENRDLFVAGSLLPDAAEFADKKKTHTRPDEGDESSSDGARMPFWMKAGWECHLQLDHLWQARCLWGNVHRLPLLWLRYRKALSFRYYEELSGLDVELRQNISPMEIEALEELIRRLRRVPMPAGIPVKADRWQAFLDALAHDLQKDQSGPRTSIVGLRKFRRFCRMGRDLMEKEVQRRVRLEKTQPTQEVTRP